MEVQPQLQSDIARLLELIKGTNSALEALRRSGKPPESLMVRQEQHLHQQYTAQLDQLMKPFKLGVYHRE